MIYLSDVFLCFARAQEFFRFIIPKGVCIEFVECFGIFPQCFSISKERQEEVDLWVGVTIYIYDWGTTVPHVCHSSVRHTKQGVAHTTRLGVVMCTWASQHVYVICSRNSSVRENLNLEQSTLTPLPFETNRVVAHMIWKASPRLVLTSRRHLFRVFEVSVLLKTCIWTRQPCPPYLLKRTVWQHTPNCSVLHLH